VTRFFSSQEGGELERYWRPTLPNRQNQSNVTVKPTLGVKPPWEYQNKAEEKALSRQTASESIWKLPKGVRLPAPVMEDPESNIKRNKRLKAEREKY
jgi:hypothetical protein